MAGWRNASSPATFILLSLLTVVGASALRFDDVPSIATRPVQDKQLQDYIRASVRWLQSRAVSKQYALLNAYAEQLQLVLRQDCAHCVDYYEAAGLLGLLGKTAIQIIKDAKDDTHYPVVRRSYVAAIWLLQRSKQFVWETTHMPSAALSTMFRLYLGHVHRAKGRTVSLHHISKCGGTTMCQLAASNRCSNPHLNQEKNCVLNDRLDAPLWMVGHNVSPQGVRLNPAIGSLDIEPAEPPSITSFRHRFALEPRMDMWLMYACPYMPNGPSYNCKARAADAHESGTTFLANERTLTRENDVSQVCSEFLNAVILREPVPHVISILAEVKYRYVRQMATKHNILNWQPTAWNLTWWENLGPALVGNYAARTLIGRESLCRSARNMGEKQLMEAQDSLLSFDMVLTLGRSQDIDLVITTMLGWPARNFSSQPGARVREVSVDLATKGKVAVGDSKESKGGVRLLKASEGAGAAALSSSSMHAGHSTHGRSLLAMAPQTAVIRGAVKRSSKKSHKHSLRHKKSKRHLQRGAAAGAGVGIGHVDHHHVDHHGDPKALLHGDTAGVLHSMALGSGGAAIPPEGLSPKQLEQQAAVMLATTTWYDRQGRLLGVAGDNDEVDKAAVHAATGQPQVQHTGQRTKHGAHVVEVTYKSKQGENATEKWHSFPRHAFAFLAEDMAKLEQLTALDLRLYHTADLMFNLDTVWLQAMLGSSHYRKKLMGVAATQTSCGFAGMIPVDPTLLKEDEAMAET